MIVAVRAAGAVVGVLMALMALGLALLPVGMFADLTGEFIPENLLLRLAGGSILAGSTVNSLFFLKDRSIVKRLVWVVCVAVAIFGFFTMVKPYWLLDVGLDVLRYTYAAALAFSAPGILVFATAERTTTRASA